MSAPAIRVLLVDDSSVVRRLLSQALAQHSEIEVVGTAANGVLALNKLPQLNPDLVILDVEMPEMDGITTLGYIRQSYPRLPVIMFSTLTERGASTTFDALAAGASDYVLKPSNSTGETLDQVVSTMLVPKIVALTRSRFGFALQHAIASSGEPAGQPPSRSLSPGSSPMSWMSGGGSLTTRPTLPSALNRPLASGIPTVPAAPSLGGAVRAAGMPLVQRGEQGHVLGAKNPFPEKITTKTSVVSPSLIPRANSSKRPSMAAGAARKPIQIVAIAASTGGPNALAEVLPKLPHTFPVPIVIVQHIPPIFTRCLADRLAARSELRVIESGGGERLLPGYVYIAPGNHHLELTRDGEVVSTLLSDGPPENSCRPAADVLFRSVARAYGPTALCVVMTGMGQDGLRGSRDVHEAGGRVLVQSGSTCVIWGMPKAVEEAGIAEAVVPLAEISAAILQRVGIGTAPLRTPEKGR